MFHVEHDRCCENHSMEVGSAGRKTERDVPRGTSTEISLSGRCSTWNHTPATDLNLWNFLHLCLAIPNQEKSLQ